MDSDDWVNKEAYVQILKTLYELLRGPQTVDLLISNFVYEKQGATRKKNHAVPQMPVAGQNIWMGRSENICRKVNIF